MFKCLLGNLTLEGGHVDISYRNRDVWPALAAEGAVRSICFDLGDPEAGPTVQLGLIGPVTGAPLDWKHGIDPVHHHGSDQFRILSAGGWVLANREMEAGDFSFQEAGWVYQERPTEPHIAWMALVMADRRGARSTKRFERDKKSYFRNGSEGEPFAQIGDSEAPYPHPAGDKGIAAIETSLGRCRRGYLFAKEDSMGAGDVVSGLLGDPVAGPIIHVLNAGANQAIVPEMRIECEIMAIVVAGSGTISGAPYGHGDIRVQSAGLPLNIRAGPEGMKVALLISDRRAVTASKASGPEWMGKSLTDLCAGLEPAPGGTWR